MARKMAGSNTYTGAKNALIFSIIQEKVDFCKCINLEKVEIRRYDNLEYVYDGEYMAGLV